jgi:hypothetical protein
MPWKRPRGVQPRKPIVSVSYDNTALPWEIFANTREVDGSAPTMGSRRHEGQPRSGALGARQTRGGTARIKEAVAAFRALLTRKTHQLMLWKWALSADIESCGPARNVRHVLIHRALRRKSH